MIHTILIRLVTKIFGIKKNPWKIYKTIAISIILIGCIWMSGSLVQNLQAANLINSDANNLSMKGKATVNSQGTQAILDWCQVIGEYMRDNHYYYPKNSDGSLNPNLGHYDIRYNDGKSKECCCATYVSWVLQEAGLIDKHTNYVGDFNIWLGNDKKNWLKLDGHGR